MSFKYATAEDARQFAQDGYIILRGLFDAEEMELLSKKSRHDGMLDKAEDRVDESGKSAKLVMWKEPGDDLYGMFSRCRRIVDSMEMLLGGEVYHYHSKMSLKQPKVGGAWEWHQDYGYWYTNGVLMPDMASCYVAIDPATKENGCLQVLKGSHLMGRVDHQISNQAGIDPDIIAAAEKRFERVYCEMDAGDAVFFHSNLLHASAANNSDTPRWGMICCYNRADNEPFKDTAYGRFYSKLHKVDDTAIKEVGRPAVAAL